MTDQIRDFQGYGQNPPDVRWPEKAHVAVSFVLNIEEGAELSMRDGDERNEGVYEAVEEVRGAPDPCQDSHYEYGTRVGYWRIIEALGAAGVASTLNACGRAIERSPWLARDAVERGHEISCHGWRWESHVHMAEEPERRAIARTVAAISAATGVTPVGWHTRSASSVNTRRLLVEHVLERLDPEAVELEREDVPAGHQLDRHGQPALVVGRCGDACVEVLGALEIGHGAESIRRAP